MNTSSYFISLNHKNNLIFRGPLPFNNSLIHTAIQATMCSRSANVSCYYCQQHPLRMDPEKFQELSLLPLPLLDATKEHYRPFTELYGDQPSEKDRPSMQQSGDQDAIEADTKHKALFNSSKVWGILHCQECLKPRCVYAVRKLGLNEKVLLDTVEESKTYCCSCAIFPPSSALGDTVVVRQNIGCSNPIEVQYTGVFSTGLLLLWCY